MRISGHDHDVRFMQAAEAEAERALESDEVPVGCVFVRESEIVATGHNLTNVDMDATRHAEMVAIDKLWSEARNKQPVDESRQLLAGCTLERVVYGCANDKFGGNGSVMRLQTLCSTTTRTTTSSEQPGTGTSTQDAGYQVTGGLRAEQAIALFKTFYARENVRAPVPKKRKDGEMEADGGP